MALTKRGVRATCLHSGLDSSLYKQAIDSLNDDELRLLYLAPERLKGFATRKIIASKVEEGKRING